MRGVQQGLVQSRIFLINDVGVDIAQRAYDQLFLAQVQGGNACPALVQFIWDKITPDLLLELFVDLLDVSDGQDCTFTIVQHILQFIHVSLAGVVCKFLSPLSIWGAEGHTQILTHVLSRGDDIWTGEGWKGEGGRAFLNVELYVFVFGHDCVSPLEL